MLIRSGSSSLTLSREHRQFGRTAAQSQRRSGGDRRRFWSTPTAQEAFSGIGFAVRIDQAVAAAGAPEL
ncbi:MAG: hypothetical protein R2838_25810 [Caldilineaceae bacterium]